MQSRTELVLAAKTLGVLLSEQQVSQLDAYLSLIQKWNRAYNLVGTCDRRQLILRHLLDSLTVAPFIRGASVLDAGSGAGLPGIPLAIALPGISFTLLDANGKKIRFMRQTVIELKLNNVELAQTRLEHYSAHQAMVLARAFAPLEEALEQLAKACVEGGRILIMSGVKPARLPRVAAISGMLMQPLSIPGLTHQRHVLIANKKTDYKKAGHKKRTMRNRP